MASGAHEHPEYYTREEQQTFAEGVVGNIAGQVDQLAGAVTSLADSVIELQGNLASHTHVGTPPPPPPPPPPDPEPEPEPPPSGSGPYENWFSPTADANTAFLFANKSGNRENIPGFRGNLNMNGGTKVDAAGGPDRRNRWVMPVYRAEPTDGFITVRVSNRGDWYVGGEFSIQANRAGMPISEGTDANLSVVAPDGLTGWDLYACVWQSSTLLTCRSATRFDMRGSAWFGIDGWPKHRIADIEARDGHSGTRACGLYPPFGNLPPNTAEFAASGLPYMLGVGAGPDILGGPSGPPGNRNEDWQFPALRADWLAAESYLGYTEMGAVLSTDRDRSGEMTTPAGKALARTAVTKGLLIQDFAGSGGNITLYASLDFEFDAAFEADYKRLGQYLRRWRAAA